jgi:hypothetical protein
MVYTHLTQPLYMTHVPYTQIIIPYPPLLQSLFSGLFAVLENPDLPENDYVMKCVMRMLVTIGSDIGIKPYIYLSMPYTTLIPHLYLYVTRTYTTLMYQTHTYIILPCLHPPI